MPTIENSAESATKPSDLTSQVDSLRNEVSKLKEKQTIPTRKSIDLETRVLELECKNKIHEAEEVLKKEFSTERKWLIGLIIALLIALIGTLTHFL